MKKKDFIVIFVTLLGIVLFSYLYFTAKAALEVLYAEVL